MYVGGYGMSKDFLKEMLAGFDNFKKENYLLNPDRMKDLIENGQHPDALVIACSDSRSCPEEVFDRKPGEIFVGRHIAALVPPHDPTDEDDTVAASIEYAVEHLKVKHIIVVGHTHCGGIAGLASDVKEGAVGHWIQRACEIIDNVESKFGKDLSDSEKLKAMEQESIVWSLNNLKTYPVVRKAVKEDGLELHAWQFDMGNGKLLAYDEDKGSFKLIAGDVTNATVTNNNKKHSCCCGKKA